MYLLLSDEAISYRPIPVSSGYLAILRHFGSVPRRLTLDQWVIQGGTGRLSGDVCARELEFSDRIKNRLGNMTIAELQAKGKSWVKVQPGLGPQKSR